MQVSYLRFDDPIGVGIDAVQPKILACGEGVLLWRSTQCDGLVADESHLRALRYTVDKGIDLGDFNQEKVIVSRSESLKVSVSAFVMSPRM